MPKFSQIARIKFENRNGPVIEHAAPTKRVHNPDFSYNAKDLIAFIGANPGSSVYQIAAAFNGTTDDDRTRIAGIMYYLINKPKSPIKRIRQDGLLRYYAANYKLTTDAKPDLPLRPARDQDSKITRQSVLAYVGAHPDQTAIEISAGLGFTDEKERRRVTNTLSRLVMQNSVETSGERFSGFKPGSGYHYRIKEQPAPKEIAPAPNVDVVTIAKDFYWQTGSNDLKEFVTWYENR